MSPYDWLMAVGTAVIIGIVVYGFWNAYNAIERPDNWQGQQQPPMGDNPSPDIHSPGGND